eukprot:scaffold15062_cov60-Cyclotella_meneghiniana.AAC.1
MPTTSSADKPFGCQSCDCNCHGKVSKSNQSSELNAEAPSTPVKDKSVSEDDITPPQSNESTSSKRRRLISFDSTGEEFGNSAKKLNYESSLPSDLSESERSYDASEDFQYETARQMTAKKLWKANYLAEDDRLVQTTARCKLFEFVTYYDVTKGETLATPPWLLTTQEEKDDLQAQGKWKYRGTGQVRFIQTLEEGYNCGMIRMEMIHEGTLNTLMCHELLDEPMIPISSKKGKSYTWKCKDWAYRTMPRTFAIRFSDEYEATKWKSLAEQSKVNNSRIRRGIDVPESKEVDDLSDVLRRMCTM